MGFVSTNVKYTEVFKGVMKDIWAKDKELRGKAAAHVKSAVRKKIDKNERSAPGEPPGKVTGNLLKGLRSENKKTMALVGFKAPAYHANLLEFGASGSRKGPMAARPFFFSTFAEEAGAVESILSEQRV